MMPENASPAPDSRSANPPTSADAPKSIPTSTPNLPARPEVTIEYDEFGLPINKPRKEISLQNGGDNEQQGNTSKSIPKTDSQKDLQKLEKKVAGLGIQLPSAESPKDEKPTVSNGPTTETPVLNPHTIVDDKKHPSVNAEEVSPHTTSSSRRGTISGISPIEKSSSQQPTVSEWSHQQLTQTNVPEKEVEDEGEWQEMPAYAPYDIYDDDGKLIARETEEIDDETAVYSGLGGAGKGYTRVQIEEDAKSATSMDDDTAYLFKERGTNLQDEDDEARDPLSQLQATKGLLNGEQRIAYVGLVRLAMATMIKELESLERTSATKKVLDQAKESTKMWSQKMMVRLYSHMEIDAAEQIMIEQLSEHGLQPEDLTPALMRNARIKNPMREQERSARPSIASPPWGGTRSVMATPKSFMATPRSTIEDYEDELEPLPAYQEHEGDDLPEVRTPSQLPNTRSLDIDIRWTILCDLFLVLIVDSNYDCRSRQLLEKTGSFLEVPWLDICRFEKRVTDALEMQESANKEKWDEEENMENRRKKAQKRRLVMMGLATVGGGLVIGLSAGLLAPVIGAGLAAGFTTIGVAGTSSFLAGAGGAAIVTTTGVLTGGTIGVRAADRRTGAVKTFEYRPLHNNKRVNLIITVAGWMTGKVDDVRLPYSTVDPIMGDIYSVCWEPEMLTSMGQTINILATEALTQGLQQVLGATILVALMSAIQLPVVLTKLSYLIDNPWTVSLARADLAGLILADSIIDRNLGARPITLVGFSLGSRVIYSCLREMAKRHAFGYIQNAYLFGSPVVAKKDEYTKARSIVSGRFVNGYATNDWILGYLFRATSGGVMSVAGLGPVAVPGIENFDVTELVPGHMSYRQSMPKLLREVGWIVESDEFAEIEDPDPDNHDRRQRELINEIEEARKELENKPEKKRFGLFKTKKYTEKKEWETYDEKNKELGEGHSDDPNKQGADVLFDIDAIRKEAAELTIQGMEIKQLESTLPPMQLDLPSSNQSSPYSTLRGTKSFNDSIGSTTKINESKGPLSAAVNGYEPKKSTNYSYEEYDEFHGNGDDITMTFETPYKAPEGTVFSSNTAWDNPSEKYSDRPSLTSSNTMPSLNAHSGYNAWADEYDDEFGKEKEVKMTFE